MESIFQATTFNKNFNFFISRLESVRTTYKLYSSQPIHEEKSPLDNFRDPAQAENIKDIPREHTLSFPGNARVG